MNHPPTTSHHPLARRTGGLPVRRRRPNKLPTLPSYHSLPYVPYPTLYGRWETGLRLAGFLLFLFPFFNFFRPNGAGMIDASYILVEREKKGSEDIVSSASCRSFFFLC